MQPQLSSGAPGVEASILKDTVRTGQLEVVMRSFLTKSGPFKVQGYFFKTTSNCTVIFRQPEGSDTSQILLEDHNYHYS